MAMVNKALKQEDGGVVEGSVRILYLEDNPTDVELAKAILAADGIDTELFAVDNREEFIAMLDQKKFDIILSDHALAAFDGSQALRMVREQDKEIPFIFVSGKLGEELAIESLKQGATDYVLKHRISRLPVVVRRAVQEIQERARKKQAEEALTESDKKFQILFQLAGDAILTVLPSQKKLIEVNEAAEHLLGYSKEELVTLSPDDIIAPEDREEQSREQSKQLAEKGYFFLETMWICKDGTRKPVAVNGKPFMLGDEIHLQMIARDITEQKRVEHQLREQADLLDIDPTAVVVRDLEDKIMFWSKGAEKLYGMKTEEVLHKKMGDVLSGIPSVEYSQAMEKLLKDAAWEGEFHHTIKDGKRIETVNRWKLISGEDERPKSIYSVTVDVTEQKKLESQFLRAQRMESIGTLAGGIAHDLNNVLGPILLSIEVIRKHIKDEMPLRLLETIESSARRGASLIKQVLSFARGLQGERSLVQPRHIINEIQRIATDTFPKSIKTVSFVPKDLWPISADATQIHQVLMNLCVNARDAMPDGGTLELKAENIVIDEQYARLHVDAKPGPHVLITVTDTGSGIPQTVLERIFEPFFTTKDEGKGTGLGLSTALTIVKTHGGFIHVYSEMGKGTKFGIYLPSLRATDTEQSSTDQLQLPMGNGEHILVVDDEEAVREIMRNTLEAFGYKVLAAGDGTEAVQMYAESKGIVAAVITDMVMPFMDGPATMRVLRRMNPQSKFIAMSGMAEDANLVRTADFGVVPFLQKPFTAEKLLTKLHDLLVTK
jgi:PAS domain S-box-containing protein